MKGAIQSPKAFIDACLMLSPEASGANRGYEYSPESNIVQYLQLLPSILFSI